VTGVVEILMPKLSDSMEEATVLARLKRPGDDVRKGEPLVEVETDKATVVYEAELSGVLEDLAVGEGETAALGAVVAHLRTAGAPARTVAAPTDGRAAKPPPSRAAEVEFRDAIGQALDEELERDERVIFYGEDVAVAGGVFAVTPGLYEKYGPERVFDTPISELAITGAAYGAAQMPVSWLMGIPGLKIAAPSSPSDARLLLKAAIRDDNPVVFFEHKRLYSPKGGARRRRARAARTGPRRARGIGPHARDGDEPRVGGEEQPHRRRRGRPADGRLGGRGAGARHGARPRRPRRRVANRDGGLADPVRPAARRCLPAGPGADRPRRARAGLTSRAGGCQTQFDAHP
jgi:pyruvate/2-oxoglutarate dehydrogenase complex dihydrolipoamide acyltransferase (E2) component